MSRARQTITQIADFEICANHLRTNHQFYILVRKISLQLFNNRNRRIARLTNPENDLVGSRIILMTETHVIFIGSEIGAGERNQDRNRLPIEGFGLTFFKKEFRAGNQRQQIKSVGGERKTDQNNFYDSKRHVYSRSEIPIIPVVKSTPRPGRPARCQSNARG